MSIRTIALAVSIAVTLASPRVAAACATCGSGDPTLTTMGTELPFGGRVRFGARLSYRWDSLGTSDIDRVDVHETLLSVTASYAPASWVALSLELPTLVRDVRWVNAAHAVVAGPGDAEVRGRFVLLRDRAFAPEHVLAVTAGLKLPTSVDQSWSSGQLLPYEAQTGTGTLDALAGLFYSHLADGYAIFATATVAVPMHARFVDAPGPSLRATVALQVRFDRWLSLRGAVDVRADAPGALLGRSDPRTDAFALFASPDLVWAPITDLVLAFGVRVPVVQIRELPRDEGWSFVVSTVGDL